MELVVKMDLTWLNFYSTRTISLGSSRDVKSASFANLRRFSILDKVKLLSMVPENFHSVLMTIKEINPDEIIS